MTRFRDTYYTMKQLKQREIELKRLYKRATGQNPAVCFIEEIDPEQSGAMVIDNKFWDWLIYRIKL